MKKIFTYGCFVACLVIGNVAHAVTVHSLDQIPDQIKSKEGKAIFASEMNGDDQPDELGVDFWTSQSKLMPGDIVKLIDPQYADDEWSLISMRAWPNQKNRYISVACLSQAEPTSFDSILTENCFKYSNIDKKIIVAVLDYDGVSPPKLATLPFKESIEEDKSGYLGKIDKIKFNKSAFIVTNNNEDDVIGNINRLDFAHYQLNSKTLAFGIRIGAQVGYAGGFASTQWVTLFAIVNGKLQPVLKVKTYNLVNNAGQWHDDGTRDHIITEEEYVLSILPHQTNGFFDIKYSQREPSGKKSKIYHWNAEQLNYQ